MEFEINPNCKDLIQKGICKADCCGCVPIYAGYWERLKKYAQTKNYKLFKFTHKGEKFIKPITEDFKCIFVKNDYSCAIHHTKLRPDVCIKFGTDKKEPLLSCPHINKDKQKYILEAEKNIINKLAGKGDKCAKELINRNQ